MQRLPGGDLAARFAGQAFVEATFPLPLHFGRVLPVSAVAAEIGKAFLRRQVRDPEIREKLTPKYAVGCKRPSFHNAYLKTFNRDNVLLETEAIERITPTGIRTTAGDLHKVDVLILATGFKVMEPGNMPPFPVQGPGGDLEAFWRKNRMQAYEGVSVPGFPNFFAILGPYGYNGASYFNLIETQTRHILRVPQTGAQRGLDAGRGPPGSQRALLRAHARAAQEPDRLAGLVLARRTPTTSTTTVTCRSAPRPRWRWRGAARASTSTTTRSRHERRLRIAGARVVITGAGSGIGRATAVRCARAGADVICVDINGAAAEETAYEIGGEPWICDVADADAGPRARGRARRAVDVLVNNAGVGIGGPFLEASVDDWDWLMSINLDGVAYGCRAFGTGMVERRRGHIVNVASGAAYMMSRDMAAYCASKAAVLALSRCLRADWAGTGVGVSAICPGVINTPIPANTRMFGSMATRQARIVKAFRFAHSPDLVAKAIVRAVERNQAVVPVGIEAEIAYRLLPFVPQPIQALATRVRL